MKTKRTQADRNYELFCKLKDTVFSLWVDVRKSQCTFAQYLERKADCQSRLVWQGSEKLTKRDARALEQYDDAFYRMNAFEKVWVHTFDGRAYLSWNTLPEAGREKIRTQSGTDGLSVHVWAGPEVFDGALVSSLKLWGELDKSRTS